MSAPLQLNIIEQNAGSGSNHQQFQASDIHALKTAYVEPGTDIQINAIQANQASGNNIQQGQFTDIDAVARALEANPYVGDVHVNLIQANQASGTNIDQGQIAVVNAHGGYSTNHGFSRGDDCYYPRGDDCYYPCDPCYVTNPCVDGNAQENVVQANQASGRNINQFQNADVNVDGGLSTNFGFSRGDDCFYPGGGDHYYGQFGDAQSNVLQINQAAGKNIDQFQNADVNVDAFGGHNTFYDCNTIDNVVHGFGADCHPVFEGCADAVFLPTYC